MHHTHLFLIPGGRSFLPTSVAGFMQAKRRKSSCLTTGLTSLMKKGKNRASYLIHKYFELLSQNTLTMQYTTHRQHPLSSPNTNPLSMSTTEPDLLSSRPLKHSRVSAIARLISSNNTQSPFWMACTNVPSTKRKANELSAFFCCFLSW